MPYVNVKYKGNSLTQFSAGNKTLQTAGKYCEDDIQVRIEQSQNDILFHFNNDMLNYGKTPAIISDVTGLELSYDQHKFGTRSLRCGNTQKINNLQFLTNMQFQNYDFTLDFWIYPTNLESSQVTTSIVPFASAYRSLALYLNTDRIELSVTSNAASWDHSVAKATSLSNNNWYHIAIVRSGSTVYLFLDGVKTTEINFGTNAISKSDPFTIASNPYTEGNRLFTGFIDEFRYIKGTAVWTADFTPPTEPYV